MQQHSVTTIAFALHLSGRVPVAEGLTLAHATSSPAARPFVEWTDLPARVIVGRHMTAAALLSKFEITSDENAASFVPDLDPEVLAEAIHDAERAAVDGGFVLVQLSRPWISFAELPEAAQAGRRRQAAYLAQRFTFAPRG